MTSVKARRKRVVPRFHSKPTECECDTVLSSPHWEALPKPTLRYQPTFEAHGPTSAYRGVGDRFSGKTSEIGSNLTRRPFASLASLPAEERRRLAALVHQLAVAEAQKQALEDASNKMRAEKDELQADLEKTKAEKGQVAERNETVTRKLQKAEELLKQYEVEIDKTKTKVSMLQEGADAPELPMRDKWSVPSQELDALLELQHQVSKIVHLLEDSVHSSASYQSHERKSGLLRSARTRRARSRSTSSESDAISEDEISELFPPPKRSSSSRRMQRASTEARLNHSRALLDKRRAGIKREKTRERAQISKNVNILQQQRLNKPQRMQDASVQVTEEVTQPVVLADDQHPASRNPPEAPPKHPQPAKDHEGGIDLRTVLRGILLRRQQKAASRRTRVGKLTEEPAGTAPTGPRPLPGAKHETKCECGQESNMRKDKNNAQLSANKNEEGHAPHTSKAPTGSSHKQLQSQVHVPRSTPPPPQPFPISCPQCVDTLNHPSCPMCYLQTTATSISFSIPAPHKSKSPQKSQSHRQPSIAASLHRTEKHTFLRDDETSMIQSLADVVLSIENDERSELIAEEDELLSVISSLNHL